ncbi:hypothetical protein DOTSEDRAFT_67672 [Dothistroma septosporum NZE10]|uniref:Uncharacterized protein n=1 Tax=Dothistroma septosporum (strain NZE10 / CBS 128990) TaxID=675120 RepID=N1Q246_DOTSN|nr:hypothetical protein DOTSEDRAFT_67672 [Dothistroma septosporum NZE10]
MSLGYLPKFFHSQFLVTPPVPTQDCTGRTIIVTGGNTGLGKEAARHYVRLNCEKLIIACRSGEKGEAAKQDIENTTGRKGVIEVWQLDLQDYDSVKEFCKRARTLKRIDTLLENAGIATQKYYNVGGNESTITVNVISTFLMALLLLPKLQETGQRFNTIPTLTIVSSEVHFFTSFPERESSQLLATLNSESEANMSDRYNVSKLLEVLSCREIAREHSAQQLGVTLNFVNPGWCHSELMREISNPLIWLIKRIMCRSTEVGSRTLVHAGLQGVDTHGKFMSDSQIANCAPLVEGPEGPELQKRLWAEVAAQLNQIEPGVTKVLDAR